MRKIEGATVFGYHVSDPERYGVVDFDADGSGEKPSSKSPPFRRQTMRSRVCILWMDPRQNVQNRSRHRRAGNWKSHRCWRAICTTERLRVEKMGRGYAWLDTGTHASLLDASNFVRTLTERQGLQVGSPDELAYELEWISKDGLGKRAELFGKNKYGQYLLGLRR